MTHILLVLNLRAGRSNPNLAVGNDGDALLLVRKARGPARHGQHDGVSPVWLKVAAMVNARDLARIMTAPRAIPKSFEPSPWSCKATATPRSHCGGIPGASPPCHAPAAPAARARAQAWARRCVPEPGSRWPPQPLAEPQTWEA